MLFLKHASAENRYERIDQDARRIIEQHRQRREEITAQHQTRRLIEKEREAA